jgi:hypothetical protein
METFEFDLMFLWLALLHLGPFVIANEVVEVVVA